MLTFDTETCGFTGPIVLVQYQVEDGNIELYEPWVEPVQKTLDLIEWICEQTICGFNLAFDWFKICQMYTTLSLSKDKSALPDILEYALNEKEARLGPCLKPRGAMDVMLHSKKGPYQSLMARKNIVIRRIPNRLAWKLAEYLERKVVLREIFFSKRKVKSTKHWEVEDTKDPDFKNVVLKFKASGSLKALAQDALNVKDDDILKFVDIEPDKKWRPIEYPFAPFALAVGTPGAWNGAWPQVIGHHILHWRTNELARKYGTRDVEYTRGLYKHFGEPVPNDDDSILACLVAAVRWRGFALDLPGIRALREEAFITSRSAPKSPAKVKKWLGQVLSPIEVACLDEGTSKPVLKDIVKEYASGDPCCDNPSCSKCNGSGSVPHPVVERAAKVLAAREAAWEVGFYDKLILAGRLHASFRITGAKSGRMSGADKINPQGVKRTKAVRSKFPLADEGLDLWGGDFDAFEVTLCDAAYFDANMHKDLLEGTSVHGIFGAGLYDKTYDEIMATKGTSYDLYTPSKSGVFALIYFGTEFTLITKLGATEEQAQRAVAKWIERYPEMKRNQKSVIDSFCSMKQPVAFGKVFWHEPAESIETLFGFKRYFTLENIICKTLFDVASEIPAEWNQIDEKVVRKDREQKVGGATRSALYGAAFGLQGKNMRAAGNHKIQGSGAQITKRVQCAIWEHQPYGVNPWIVQPMNIHDEILCPTLPRMAEAVKATVETTIQEYRSTVPLLQMGWKKMETWASK